MLLLDVGGRDIDSLVWDKLGSLAVSNSRMSHQLQWKQLNPPDEIIFTFIPPAALYMGENLPSNILLRGVTHTNDFAILRQNLNEFAQQMVEKIRFFFFGWFYNLNEDSYIYQTISKI